MNPIKSEDELCAICLTPMSKSGVKLLGHITKDHITPKSLGGSNSKNNIQLAHQRCNAIRGNKSMEWVESNREAFMRYTVGSRKRTALRKKYRAKGLHYIGLNGVALDKYVKYRTASKIQEL